MRQEWSFHNGRKHRDPILIALPLPYHNLIAAEVNVLDSESETLQQTKAGTRVIGIFGERGMGLLSASVGLGSRVIMMFGGHIHGNDRPMWGDPPLLDGLVTYSLRTHLRSKIQ
jgi:hypothetical protein